jgi:hypothetical protein
VVGLRPSFRPTYAGANVGHPCGVVEYAKGSGGGPWYPTSAKSGQIWGTRRLWLGWSPKRVPSKTRPGQPTQSPEVAVCFSTGEVMGFGPPKVMKTAPVQQQLSMEAKPLGESCGFFPGTRALKRVGWVASGSSSFTECLCFAAQTEGAHWRPRLRGQVCGTCWCGGFRPFGNGWKARRLSLCWSYRGRSTA